MTKNYGMKLASGKVRYTDLPRGLPFRTTLESGADGWRYLTPKSLVALLRLKLIIQTSLLAGYMRKTACSVLRVSIGRRV